MKFQVLISTVDDNFLKSSKIKKNFLVINQLVTIDKSKFSTRNVLNFNEVGLSRSRNRAIQYASGYYCILCDDDIEHVSGLEDLIVDIFDQNPSADIVTMQITNNENELYKNNYKNNKFWHNKYSILSVSSPEIAFRLNKVKEKDIKFSEQFGLGTIFPTGEENIFLADALKRGLRILYVPMVVGKHPGVGSGGMFVDNKKLIKAKGALFYRIFGLQAFLLSFYFALKNYRKSNFNFTYFLYLMYKGIIDYKKYV